MLLQARARKQVNKITQNERTVQQSIALDAFGVDTLPGDRNANRAGADPSRCWRNRTEEMSFFQ